MTIQSNKDLLLTLFKNDRPPVSKREKKPKPNTMATAPTSLVHRIAPYDKRVP